MPLLREFRRRSKSSARDSNGKLSIAKKLKGCVAALWRRSHEEFMDDSLRLNSGEALIESLELE